MSKARDNILSRLRTVSIQPSESPEQTGPQLESWMAAERVQRFRERMEAVRAEVLICQQHDWVEKLATVCAEKQLKNLLVSKDCEPGLAVHQSDLPLPELREYLKPVEDWKDQLFNDIEASLTSTRCGFAETGTLVLWPSPEEPRLMSLVPPVHFAVLDTSKLYSTFAEAVEVEGWAARGMPTNALLISGPSKTADIEQTLAYGVHGPKELIVLLIE